jgi:hypothetical protein
MPEQPISLSVLDMFRRAIITNEKRTYTKSSQIGVGRNLSPDMFAELTNTAVWEENNGAIQWLPLCIAVAFYLEEYRIGLSNHVMTKIARLETKSS